MKKIIGIISLCALSAIICSSLLAQGAKAGWPTALIGEWGLPNLKQPAGTKSSYTGENEGYTLTVYMTGANAKTLQELKQQIEKVTGKQMKSYDKNSCGTRLDKSNRASSVSGIAYLNLTLKGNLLEMEFFISMGD